MTRALLLLALVGSAACTKQAGPVPLVRVASSAEAQTAFNELQRSWDSKERLDARDLEQRFRQFAILFSRDPLVPVVEAYLAILLAEQGRTSDAAAIVAVYSREPDGATRDLFDVVKAYVLRKGGKAQDALALLQPLAGKIIDSAARALLLEELAMAALEGHADYEAIGYFDAWLIGTTGPDHERARARIAELLGKLPAVVLESAYQVMRGGTVTKNGKPGQKGAGYSKEIRILVAERLSTIAVEEGDTVLARWLLDPSAGTAPASLALQAGLGELAASRRGLRAIEGRSIGLLLPSANLGRLTEAADVLRGLSFALGLPDPKAQVRLVVREGGEQIKQMQQALDELAGEGVSVVVAGFDPDTAQRALAWGDAANVAVVALVPPLLAKTPRHGFVIGEDVHPQLQTLAEGWKGTAAAKKRVVFLAGTRTPDQELATAGETPVDVGLACDDDNDAALRENKTGAYWVSGPLSCTAGLFRQLVRIGKERSGLGEIALGTTLESYDAQKPTSLTLTQLTLAAGILPAMPSAAPAPLVAEVQAYSTRYGLTPNYWASIGHDVGVLSLAATKTLPADRTTSDQTVYMRRALVEAGLVSATAPLWSTDSTGFAGKRLLPRTLRAVPAPIVVSKAPGTKPANPAAVGAVTPGSVPRVVAPAASTP